MIDDPLTYTRPSAVGCVSCKSMDVTCLYDTKTHELLSMSCVCGYSVTITGAGRKQRVHTKDPKKEVNW